MTSKDRSQLELLPPRLDPHVVEVTAELIRSIRKQPTLLGAWCLAQDLAALEDKEVYSELDMDASHWTKIRRGRASPPADERFVRYFDAVQNEIPLIWLVEARGYDWTSLRKHRSAEARRIAELEGAVADRDRTIRLMVEAMKGKP